MLNENVTENPAKFQNARVKLIDEVVKAMDKRFTDIACPGVVEATRIADISQWPKSWDTSKGSKI